MFGVFSLWINCRLLIIISRRSKLPIMICYRSIWMFSGKLDASYILIRYLKECLKWIFCIPPIFLKYEFKSKVFGSIACTECIYAWNKGIIAGFIYIYFLQISLLWIVFIHSLHNVSFLLLYRDHSEVIFFYDSFAVLVSMASSIPIVSKTL